MFVEVRGVDSVYANELPFNFFGTGYKRIEMPLLAGFSLWRPLKWVNFRLSTGIRPSILFVKKNLYESGIGLRFLPLEPTAPICKRA